MRSVYLTPLQAWLLTRLLEKPVALRVYTGIHRLEVAIDTIDGLVVPQSRIADLVRFGFAEVVGLELRASYLGKRHAELFPAQMAAAKRPERFVLRPETGRLVDVVG